MHDAEGVFYFLAHADKKAVLDFCIMHVKENRKMCFPGIARKLYGQNKIINPPPP